jgi:hypothetical protein
MRCCRGLGSECAPVLILGVRPFLAVKPPCIIYHDMCQRQCHRCTDSAWDERRGRPEIVSEDTGMRTCASATILLLVVPLPLPAPSMDAPPAPLTRSAAHKENTSLARACTWNGVGEARDACSPAGSLPDRRQGRANVFQGIEIAIPTP